MDLAKLFSAGADAQAALDIRLPLLKSRDLTTKVCLGLPANSAAAHAKRSELRPAPVGWSDLLGLAHTYSIPISDMLHLARELNSGRRGPSKLEFRVGSFEIADGALFGTDGRHSRSGAVGEGRYELTSSSALGGSFESFWAALKEACENTVWLGTDSSELMLSHACTLDDMSVIDDSVWEIAEQWTLESVDLFSVEGAFILYRCPQYTVHRARLAWESLQLAAAS